MRLLILLGCLTSAAQAACGIDACPRPTLEDTATVDRVRLTGGLRVVGFSNDADSGQALESLAAAAWSPVDALSLGVVIPFVTLVADDRTEVGLANAVFTAEGRMDLGAAWGHLGVQLETPTGAAAVADDHLEALPYGMLQWQDSRWRARIWAGYRQAVGLGDHDHGSHGHGDHAHDHGHHHGDAAGSVADVYRVGHSEREVLYRTLVGATTLRGRFDPAIGLDGQHAIGEPAFATVLAGRAQVRSQLTEALAINLAVQIPLTEARRYDWATALRVEVGL